VNASDEASAEILDVHNVYPGLRISDTVRVLWALARSQKEYRCNYSARRLVSRLHAGTVALRTLSGSPVASRT
jgi:hypothetical protein